MIGLTNGFILTFENVQTNYPLSKRIVTLILRKSYRFMDFYRYNALSSRLGFGEPRWESRFFPQFF